jgi:GNAT superfamily N-acetyltransferase
MAHGLPHHYRTLSSTVLQAGKSKEFCNILVETACEERNMFERRIEEAGLNSWPALQQLLFDGWVMRFAQGYTKRANSVTPLYPSLLPAAEKIVQCEQLYAQQHLPVTFRLTSFTEESQQLEHILAQRGYHYLDRTLVMAARMPFGAATDNAAWRALSLADWLPIYAQFSERYRELQNLHRELLQRISPPFVYAALYQHNNPVACGLGVLEHELFGLFDIVTDAAQRRKGYGTQLITGMLDWGRQHGAQYAYLQVIDTNQVAQQMYAKFGFQQSYYYWYRQQV